MDSSGDDQIWAPSLFVHSSPAFLFGTLSGYLSIYLTHSLIKFVNGPLLLIPLQYLVDLENSAKYTIKRQKRWAGLIGIVLPPACLPIWLLAYFSASRRVLGEQQPEDFRRGLIPISPVCLSPATHICEIPLRSTITKL
ncbi:hypothetical protein EDD85DRAFT_358896 [Armillaria nabsnona]|nr:hypothetical protein EDD85DRAFT_358896 [Armillaria nabsnona]